MLWRQGVWVALYKMLPRHRKRLRLYTGAYLVVGRGAAAAPPQYLEISQVKQLLVPPGGPSLLSICPPNNFLPDTPMIILGIIPSLHTQKSGQTTE